MVNRLFAKNRIRGVSFRHRRASLTGGRGTSAGGVDDGMSQFSGSLDSMMSARWAGPSVQDVRKSAPQAFKKNDLARLLGDYGRNELHTLVSEAVEQLSRLRQITQSIQRFAPTHEPDRHFFNHELQEESESSGHPLQDVGIEILRVQRLWKLRLELLEMVAMAQDSLRNWNVKPAKKPRPPAAGSSPRPK